ncbi:hypothetical protein [Arthrobacter sp. PM3]|uniref:hypothetical protein n=1 Tax=Arthrobacter sp. PM3 TaxID=2017685 RepID=UPI000E10DEC1|nr:hypothetical protein [Arthrobacter sp. PM3]AXJ09683.1 hypothetical protein CFN17_08680 [Arthrobacter sp. PM3]
MREKTRQHRGAARAAVRPPVARATAAPALILLLGLIPALTGCSGSAGPAPSSISPFSTSPSSPAAAAPTQATPSASYSGTASAGPDASAGGGLGGFGSVVEACAAVSATVLSVMALPIAAAAGQDAAVAERARSALEQLQDKVPPELKDPIDKLKSIAEAAGPDYTKFNAEEFDQAIAPIDAWLQSHC